MTIEKTKYEIQTDRFKFIKQLNCTAFANFCPEIITFGYSHAYNIKNPTHMRVGFFIGSIINVGVRR
jgi:hypothetical protein